MKKEDYWFYEVITNNIKLISYYNNITQNEIDSEFYNSKKEIQYFFYPDSSKIDELFKDDLLTLEARLASVGLAYSEDIVLKCSDSFKQNSLNNKKQVVKLMFDKISFEDNKIIWESLGDNINNVLSNFKNDKNTNDMLIISDYSYISISAIKDLISKINKIKIDIISIEKYVRKNILWNSINKWVLNIDEELLKTFPEIKKNDDWFYYVFSKKVELLERKYKNIISKLDLMLLEDLENSDEINKTLLNLKEILVYEFNNIDHSNWNQVLNFLKWVKEKILVDVIAELKNHKKLLANVSLKENCFINNNSLQVLKSVNKDDNKKLFVSLKLFISKYFSKYYTIDENSISIKESLDIIEFNKLIEEIKNNTDDFYDFDLKESYYFTNKYSFLYSKNNKLEFFSNFLYRSFIWIIDESSVTYLKLKSSIIQNNLNALNNENALYIEKEKFDKKLQDFNKINTDLFWWLFYIAQNDWNSKDYYSICDISWNNKSNLLEIFKIFDDFVFHYSILEKYIENWTFSDFYNEVSKNKNYLDYKDKIKLVDFINSLNSKNIKYKNLNDSKIELLLKIRESVFNTLNLNSPIWWFSLTGRREVNKWTGTITPLFDIFNKISSSAYSKLYEKTKENVTNNIWYISWNTISNVDLSNFQDMFKIILEEEINDAFDELLKRTYKNCEVVSKNI